jgi:wobble nucleotide-excising tRNase
LVKAVVQGVTLMIHSLNLSEIGPFEKESYLYLKKINLIYGGNGAGKSTIANHLKDNVRISNKKSINNHYSSYDYTFGILNIQNKKDLPGIFNFQKHNDDVYKKVIELKKELVLKESEVDNLEYKIFEKSEMLSHEKLRFEDICWVNKRKLSEMNNSILKKLNTKEKLANYILENWRKHPISGFKIDELINLFQKYGKLTKRKINKIDEIKLDEIKRLESDPALNPLTLIKKRTILTDYIEKVGNIDWVLNGITFLALNDECCPFCQKSIDNMTIEQMLILTDDSFPKKIGELDTHRAAYIFSIEKIRTQLNNLINEISQSEFKKAIMDQVWSITLKAHTNLHILNIRKSNPSATIEIESLLPNLIEINELISSVNNENAQQEDLIRKAENLNAQMDTRILEAIINQTRNQIQNYVEIKYKLESEIEKLKSKKSKLEKYIESKKTNAKSLEYQISSIIPAMDSINNMLQNVGIESFRLEKSNLGNYYNLMRTGEIIPNSSLSSGEISLLGFCYFMYLIFDENNLNDTEDKIVVIDDPYNFLDDNMSNSINLILANSINRIITENLKIQLFVLTHDISCLAKNIEKYKKYYDSSLYSYSEITKNKDSSRIKNLSHRTFIQIGKL